MTYGTDPHGTPYGCERRLLRELFTGPDRRLWRKTSDLGRTWAAQVDDGSGVIVE
jgi:hypothetical protein